MSIDPPATIIDVADLVGRPGTSRQVRLDVPATETLELPLVSVTESVTVEVLLESLAGGILARGQVATQATVSCARCLRPMHLSVSTDVVELFADPDRADDPDDVEEGYEIRDLETHPVLDFDTLVRDALIDELPLRSLCGEECQGLCAHCGTDLNESTCDCTDEQTDDRWAALRGLDLPESPGAR
jgi:uncharacterized protein